SAENVFGMSWDAHGILFGQQGKGIMRVAPGGGTPEVLVPVDSDHVASAPQMLPDGRGVLFSVMKTTEDWNQAHIVVQPLGGGSPRTLIEGGSDGRYLETGHLLYAVSGVVMAAPFDLPSLTVTGSPVRVIDGVRRTGFGSAPTGMAQFTTSPSGDLVYLSGPANVQISTSDDLDLAVFDRKGASRPLNLKPGSYRSPRVSPDGKFVAFEVEDTKEANVGL